MSLVIAPQPLTTIIPAIHPIEAEALSRVKLPCPGPWCKLEKTLHPALTSRAKGFLHFARQNGQEAVAIETLRLVGEGFLKPFDKANVLRAPGDDEFKDQILEVLRQLSVEFDGLLPKSLWESFAYLACRETPNQPASILSQANFLPLPYWFVDAHFHAIGKVFWLLLHVQSRSFRATGRVFNHNCDCSCAAAKMGEGGSIDLTLDHNLFLEASGAFLSHLFVEVWSIVVNGLPFNFGMSPEAQEAFALQGHSA